jgi:hypothetical protein
VQAVVREAALREQAEPQPMPASLTKVLRKRAKRQARR